MRFVANRNLTLSIKSITYWIFFHPALESYVHTVFESNEGFKSVCSSGLKKRKCSFWRISRVVSKHFVLATISFRMNSKDLHCSAVCICFNLEKNLTLDLYVYKKMACHMSFIFFVPSPCTGTDLRMIERINNVYWGSKFVYTHFMTKILFL